MSGKGVINEAFEDIDLGTGTHALAERRYRTDTKALENGIYSTSNNRSVRGNKAPPPEKPKTSPQQEKAIHLKKSITLFHCVAILVSVTGSTSIFFSASQILRHSGSLGVTLIMLFTGGILNLTAALCFTEMGCMFPAAGGAYVYMVKVFGSFPGFITMWGYTTLLVGPVWALMAHATALYILQPFFPGCTSPVWGKKLLAGVILLSCVAVNCTYVKYVTKVQILLTSTKVIALGIIIGAGIYKMATGDISNFEGPFERSLTDPGEIALALLTSNFLYGGWQAITTLMEETKRPAKDLPRSLYISFAIVMSTFILAFVSYYAVLTHDEILMSETVADIFSDRLYSPLVVVISVLVAISSIGCLNGFVLGHSRWPFAAARGGHMPSVIGMIHVKYRTPWPATFILCFWSLVVLFTGGVDVLIRYVSLASSLLNAAVVAALLYLRWKEPAMERPFKVNLPIVILQTVVIVFMVVLSVYRKPADMGIAFGIIFLGIPLYWVGVSWKKKPKTFTNFLGNMTRVLRFSLNLQKTE